MSSVTACNCPQKPLDPACPRAKSSRQLGQQRQMSNVHRYWAGEKWINLHQKPNQNDSRPIIHIKCISQSKTQFFGRLGRLLWLDLTSRSQCPSVRMYITKCFSNLNKTWCSGRGRWVIHDHMPYDPIRGKVKVTEVRKLQKWFSKSISSASTEVIKRLNFVRTVRQSCMGLLFNICLFLKTVFFAHSSKTIGVQRVVVDSGLTGSIDPVSPVPTINRNRKELRSNLIET